MASGLAKFAAVVIVLPIAIQGCVDGPLTWAESWSRADWSSSGQLPPASEVTEPVVQVWSARTGRWKGLVATHSWLVIKDEGATSWRRYDVVGWGRPVRENSYAPDARWYGNPPAIVAELRGPEAAAAIPAIDAAILSYPWREPGTYTVWPGPNSNTFAGLAVTAITAPLRPGAIAVICCGSASMSRVELKSVSTR